MKKLLIIGSGGHAKVVLDILKSDYKNKFEIVGLISNDPVGSKINDIKVVGNDSDLERYKNKADYTFVAIGDNLKRYKISKKLKRLGFQLISIISKNSFISSSCIIDNNVVIMPGVVINTSSVINEGCIINTSSSIDHDCYIGSYSHVAPGVHLAGSVQLGEGVFLGVGVSIIPKIKIGSWSLVGAGSCVVKDIPEKTLSYGVPAKVIKNLDVKL